MRLEERVRAPKRGPHPFLRIDPDFWRSQGGLDQNALQQAPVDGRSPLREQKSAGRSRVGGLGSSTAPQSARSPATNWEQKKWCRRWRDRLK